MKTSSVYKIDFSKNHKGFSVQQFNDLFSGNKFEQVSEIAIASIGFFPHPHGDGEFALPFGKGGFSFCVRYDEKIIPSTLIKERVKEYFNIRGIGKPSRKQISEAKEILLDELVKVALPKSKLVTGYCYGEFLFLDSTGSAASRAMSFFIKTLGELKTETINISDIKHGLQKRLNKYIRKDYIDNSENEFGNFEVGSFVKLESQDGDETITYSNVNVSSNDEIQCQLEQDGYLVKEIRLIHQGSLSFKLTDKFEFKQIGVSESEELDFDHLRERWEHETTTKVALLKSAVEEIARLLGYEQQQKHEQDIEKDPLYDDVVEYIKEVKKCSVASVQRKFKIGYNRAARIIESMENNGVVSETNYESGEPRKVLL